MHAMHLLLTAVVTFTQNPPAAPPVVASPPTRSTAKALRRARIALDSITPALQEARVGLQALTGLEGLAGLESLAGLERLGSFADLNDGFDALDGYDAFDGINAYGDSYDDDGDAQDAQDPADSIYRAARRRLNANEYKPAAELFAQLRQRYPRSTYVADALYWEAFALFRVGGTEDLKAARQRINEQGRRFPSAGTHSDAETLFARIQGELARQGDSEAAEWIRTRSSQTVPAQTGVRCPDEDDDDDPRIAALNALLQMDADNAIPILKKVLERRDGCSVVLRRKAVFLVSQKRSSETEDILLNAVRSDPDAEVRGQAIFWLSQVHSDRAVGILDSLLQSTTNEELLDKVIFALSQQNSPRAADALRKFAERTNAPQEGREKAIFWLGQRHSPENAEFLRGLYARLTEQELKEKVIFSISQMGGAESNAWLMDIALNEREDIEMRKKALFWAGQSRGTDITQLVALYARVQNQEMKEQLIFVYSQRRDKEAVDKLFDIAKNDPNRELRRKAIFWLGQSRDPRVPQFLQDLLGNP